MSDADIIAALYFDSMDIYRKEKVKDPNTGVTTMKEILKYSNLQCSLDKKDEVQTGGEVGTAYISSAYKLFCRPTVDIQTGDKLIITYTSTNPTVDTTIKTSSELSNDEKGYLNQFRRLRF